MKVIRRLSRRGNSSHVSIPQRMIDYMRWHVSDGIVVEVTEKDTIVLRRVCPADLHGTQIPPLNLDLSAPVTK